MTELANTPHRTPGGHMLHGSFWMISLRWALRLTGVVSTIFLARLLSPADFGIVAAAMIVVGMLEMFNQTGQKLALIRTPNPTREHFDSAWTVSVLIGCGIGLTIFAIAPLTRAYFHDLRTVPVMQCLALRAVLGGFENIGIVNLRRNLQFDRFFRYNVYSKLISFVVTLSLAFITRNYWALVAGILTSAIATNILSYTMSAYRPRFSFAKVREIWGFSFWTLIRSIAFYLNGQIDLLAIGGFATAERMGRYAVAHDVAASPTDEINGPMVAVLFPVMATVQDNAEELRRLYLRALGWSAIICASTSTGVALIGHDLVPLLLGPKWVKAIHLIPWLAMAAGVLGLASGAFGTFDALNKPRQGARMALARLAMLVIVIAPVAFLTQRLDMVAAARLAVTVVFIPTLLLAVGRAVGVSPREQSMALWRPILAAGVMAAVISVLNVYLSTAAGPVRLVLDVLVGSAVYAATLLGAWTCVGRPESPERDALNLVLLRLERFKIRRPETRGGEVPVHICLYVAVPRTPQDRNPAAILYNFSRRMVHLAKDLGVLVFRGRLQIDHLHYRSPNDPNKGDVLIREAIRQQLRESFAPRPVRFSEFGWGRLGDDAVERINARCDLFVIAGSGYFFLDENGDFPERIRVDAAQLTGISCRKIAYGVGFNYVIERPGDDVDHLPALTPPSKHLVQAIGRQLDLISVRGNVAAENIQELLGRQARVTGDPVLFYDDGVPAPQHAPAARKKLLVGINLAVHGRISAANFVKYFPEICRLLRELKEKYPIEFVYIGHLLADRIVPTLFRLKGIAMHKRIPSAAALPGAYRDLDLNICQMMHSSILSLRSGVPTVNLAYDVKNMTLFKLMELPEFCLPMQDFEVERVIAAVDAAIAHRLEIQQRIENAKARLKRELDAFRTLIVSTTESEARESAPMPAEALAQAV